ncbi:MAG TPA: hypothetical protein VMG13_26595 [Trebonia sp.]|nr:hypothetical protein [Trebonia sp.]
MTAATRRRRLASESSGALAHSPQGAATPAQPGKHHAVTGTGEVHARYVAGGDVAPKR